LRIKRDSPLASGLVDKIDRSDQGQGQRLGGDDRNGLVLIAIGTRPLRSSPPSR